MRLTLSVEIISSERVPNAPLLSPDWPILPTTPPIARLAHLAYNSSNRQTGPYCLPPPPPSFSRLVTRSALLQASNKAIHMFQISLRWQLTRWHVVVVVDPTPPTCCQQSPAPESCGSQQSLPPGGKERLHFVGNRPEVQARKGGW